MATYPARKVKLGWRELGEILSKAEVLMPDEDIEHITPTKPRQVLLHTSRPVKEKKEG